MDVDWTYRVAYFEIYTYIELLHCTPKTNIMLYVSYISILKIKKNLTDVLVFHIM